MGQRNEILTYFRSNIFEAKSAYNAWKMIFGSRADGIVSKEMADKYVKIQKYHPSFFGIAERSFLISWIILVLHSFDRHDCSYSLKKVDSDLFDEFLSDQSNQNVIKQLKTLRDKLFAHRDTDAKLDDIKIPSMIDVDDFFRRLEDFYNKLCKIKEDSTTLFRNTEDIKHDIENLFMNLERGENVRLKEIDIEWVWEKNSNKASDKI